MFCPWNDPNTIWTPVLMAWPWFQSYRNMYPPRFFHSSTEKQVVNIISILLMKHTPISAAEIPLNQPIWCQKFHLYGYSSIKAFSGTVLNYQFYTTRKWSPLSLQNFKAYLTVKCYPLLCDKITLSMFCHSCFLPNYKCTENHYTGTKCRQERSRKATRQTTCLLSTTKDLPRRHAAKIGIRNEWKTR